MAFTELELKRYQKAMERFIEAHRPPPHTRPELDLAYRISDQSVEIFEIRPAFTNPRRTIEEPAARATFGRRAQKWRVYWQRADLEWHRYDPKPSVRSLGEFLALVEEDEHCCFFGPSSASELRSHGGFRSSRAGSSRCARRLVRRRA